MTTRTHLAVIDLGTNAIRLQVARVYSDGSYHVVSDLREPVRLGETLFNTGSLSRVAIDRSLSTLCRFLAVARYFGVDEVQTIATSAVRDAANGEAFVLEAHERCGVDLHVISGEEEARLIARGILSELSEPLARRRLALIDVGGGSTEVSVVDQGRLLRSISLPLGSVRLTQLYGRSDPLNPSDERRLREHIRSTLRETVGEEPISPRDTVAGSAGTIGALANYIRSTRPTAEGEVNRRTGFSPQELSKACATLKRMDPVLRHSAPGVHQYRSEAIVAGAMILEELCAYLGAQWVRPVRRGLRDGAMVEAIAALGIEAPRLRRASFRESPSSGVCTLPVPLGKPLSKD